MLVLGTTNADKVREIAAICRPLGVEIDTLELEIEETETTFAGNAMLKAQGYSAARPGETVLVEDSGITVPALCDLPGPWSARFADLNLETRKVTLSGYDRKTIDRLNNERLLILLEGVPTSERAAKFVVCFVAMRDGAVLFQATGEAHGYIAPEGRGNDGFGYDPVFIGRDTFGKTYAELDSARKNLRSHRKDALRQFSLWISGVLAEGNTI